MTIARKYNNEYIDISNIVPAKIKFKIEAIPKIGQKNLFKVKRSSSQRDIIDNELNNSKYSKLIKNKKNNKSKNRDYIIAKKKRTKIYLEKQKKIIYLKIN